MLDRPGGHLWMQGTPSKIPSTSKWGLKFSLTIWRRHQSAAPRVLLSANQTKPAMPRIAGPLLACALALANAPANAQAGATPPTLGNGEGAHPSTASELHEPAAQPPTVDDICRALEQSAAENAVPVEFFARVIWQESRFNALASARREPQVSHNSCRRPPAGTALPIRSIPWSCCGTRLHTCANC